MIHLNGIEDNMIANNLKPFMPTHPGEVLEDELEYRGISAETIAKKIGAPKERIESILNENAPLDAETALMLEEVLGIDAEPLMSMQMKYDMQTARRNPTIMLRIASLRKAAAILQNTTTHHTTTSNSPLTLIDEHSSQEVQKRLGIPPAAWPRSATLAKGQRLRRQDRPRL